MKKVKTTAQPLNNATPSTELVELDTDEMRNNLLFCLLVCQQNSYYKKHCF